MSLRLNEILDEWEVDSKIDLTQLEVTARDIPKILTKYLRYHNIEKMKLKKLEAEFRSLRLDKYEHYIQGPSVETKHWKSPAIGKVMKQDAKDWYVDADEDCNNKRLEIDLAQEKVDTLDALIRSIHNRHYLIQSIMQHMKWTGGG